MAIPKLSPAQIRHAMQCAAACDATVTSKDWLRAYWYEEQWSENVVMGKYDNGGGDHVFVFFTRNGKTLIKGFDHESPVSPHARDEYGIWPGIYDGIPADLSVLLQNDAVEYEDVTFCCWSIDGKTWATGNAEIPEDFDDGSSWLLEMVQMSAKEFIEWAKDYYGDSFSLIGEDGVLNAYKEDKAGLA